MRHISVFFLLNNVKPGADLKKNPKGGLPPLPLINSALHIFKILVIKQLAKITILSAAYLQKVCVGDIKYQLLHILILSKNDNND